MIILLLIGRDNVKRNIKEYALIKDSLNQSFIFQMDDENNLVFKKLNEDGNCSNDRIIENDVVDFSTNIDKKDRIHIIYLRKDGELTYGIYINEEWQRSVVRRLDTKSNKYKYLSLFLHENHVNILYAFTNIINTNLWTIEHITKGSSHWRKITATNIFCEDTFSPFYIDKDKFGNLFLIYMAREYNTNHIYYNTYNIFINKWGKSLIKISHAETDNIHPYLFIDSKDNIHVLWYSLKNDDYLMTYKQLSPIGKKKYHWEEIKLPKIICGKYPPLMYETEKELKIVCITSDGIQYLVSKNYGLDWDLENEIPLHHPVVDIIKCAHNNSDNNTNNKMNHRLGHVDDHKVQFYLPEQPDTKLPKDEDETKKIVVSEKEQEDEETEEKFVMPKEVQDVINDIKRDMELLKERMHKIEEKQNTKKGFFK